MTKLPRTIADDVEPEALHDVIEGWSTLSTKQVHSRGVTSVKCGHLFDNYGVYASSYASDTLTKAMDVSNAVEMIEAMRNVVHHFPRRLHILEGFAGSGAHRHFWQHFPYLNDVVDSYIEMDWNPSISGGDSGIVKGDCTRDAFPEGTNVFLAHYFSTQSLEIDGDRSLASQAALFANVYYNLALTAVATRESGLGVINYNYSNSKPEPVVETGTMSRTTYLHYIDPKFADTWREFAPNVKPRYGRLAFAWSSEAKYDWATNTKREEIMALVLYNNLVTHVLHIDPFINRQLSPSEFCECIRIGARNALDRLMGETSDLPLVRRAISQGKLRLGFQPFYCHVEPNQNHVVPLPMLEEARASDCDDPTDFVIFADWT